MGLDYELTETEKAVIILAFNTIGLGGMTEEILCQLHFLRVMEEYG
jgi:hypothetical protein